MNEHANLPSIACQLGHEEHQKVLIHVEAHGRTRVPDYPVIRDDLGRSFRMNVYNAPLYRHHREYCTGKDELSYSLQVNGVWEGFETVVVLDILNRGEPGYGDGVLDFGGHLGWYSILAGLYGYPVLAYEADPENVRAFTRNMELNGLSNRVSVERAWIDEGFRIPDGVGMIQFMKCDIEGKEPAAVAACMHLFRERKIRHALIEMSPVFPGGGGVSPYVQLAQDIARCGYDVADIPTKGFDKMAELEADPLGATHRYRSVRESDIEEYLRTISQTNFVFSAR